MRPPAIERMGYYPTDEPVVEIIRTYLKPPVEKGRLFDPCAGEGKAASALGKALNCETWGVELSPDRAEKAQNVMDKVYQAPWQACVLSDESVSWLYLNPPYEFDRFDGQKRLCNLTHNFATVATLCFQRQFSQTGISFPNPILARWHATPAWHPGGA